MRPADLGVLDLVGVALTVALLMAVGRLVRGPTLPDRVVALDLIAALVVGGITLHAIQSDQRVYIDTAIVVALIAFLGTIAFGQYVERRARDE
ncbi:MAG: cation:proton antiporter [Dehalococcoidia bacterium]